MEVNELIKNSPIRVFESAINGGLGKGNLGVFASRHGIGKTACLVHIATDKLLRNEHIIHVSFSGNVEHCLNWYKEVFRQISEYKSLDDAFNVYNSMRENRCVLNFSQDQVPMDKIINSLKTLIEMGSFKADAVLIDGYHLTKASEEDINKIKAFAQEMNLEVWFSVSPVVPNVKYDEYGVPETLNPYKNFIDVLVGLRYNEEKSKVIMTVVKDHNNSSVRPAGTNLDPRTMLITE